MVDKALLVEDDAKRVLVLRLLNRKASVPKACIEFL